MTKNKIVEPWFGLPQSGLRKAVVVSRTPMLLPGSAGYELFRQAVLTTRLDASQQEQCRQLQQQWQLSQPSYHGQWGAASFDLLLLPDASDQPEALWQQRLVQLLAAAEQQRQAQPEPRPLKLVPGFGWSRRQSRWLQRHSQHSLVAAECLPQLLAGAGQVYCAATTKALEGLLSHKRLTALEPFVLSGLGLTTDAYHAEPPQQAASLMVVLHQLFFVAALRPEPRWQGDQLQLEDCFRWLLVQRRSYGRYPADVYALNFSTIWRPVLRQFVQGSKVHFVRNCNQIPANATVLLWGRREPGSLPGGVRVIRIEDGFLRSVGLGAEFSRPVSWVFDGSGIYFDARCPSDLERLLQDASIGPELCQRAKLLQQRILELGLTKYNVGRRGWQRPAHPRVILVPGQVESDASIAYGSTTVKRNIDLLQQVRLAEPDAYIIYKPHPDVVAGARQQGDNEAQAAAYCDELILDVAMAELLPHIDEVHTITSLTGFEALLRGKKVVCYGQPFYAGWGLTEDKHPLARRGQQRSLEQLVAATLILYPCYISRTNGYFASPEQIVAELTDWQQTQKPDPWLPAKKWLRWCVTTLKGFR